MLLIAVLVLCLPLSWFAVRMEKARSQRKAVERIYRLGGRVMYDWEYDALESGRRPRRPATSWLRTLIGDDFLDTVMVVVLYDTHVGNPELEYLDGLTTLKALSLDRTEITDAGLEYCEGLTNLKWLSLENTQVTDAGLEYLKGLTSLEELFLDDTQVGGAGLEHLQGLTNLESLQLNNTQVLPEDVKKLQEALPNCKITY
jgi:hypothetical protein